MATKQAVKKFVNPNPVTYETQAIQVRDTQRYRVFSVVATEDKPELIADKIYVRLDIVPADCMEIDVVVAFR